MERTTIITYNNHRLYRRGIGASRLWDHEKNQLILRDAVHGTFYKRQRRLGVIKFWSVTDINSTGTDYRERNVFYITECIINHKNGSSGVDSIESMFMNGVGFDEILSFCNL